jgi:hypothetical protein
MAVFVVTFGSVVALAEAEACQALSPSKGVAYLST